MAAHTNEATICTVSTPFHKRLLYYNHQLTKALNPGHETSWVIVNNPEMHISRQRVRQLLEAQGRAHNEKTYKRTLFEEKRRYHDFVKLHQYIDGERILGGLSLAEVMARLPATSPVGGESPAQFEYRKDKVLQSYHHAFNLELALSKVKTRFAILLDPDLYVVRHNWLLELITRMKLEQLAVFGAPWNPRYFQKFRYFPATHFMILDLKKIAKADVNLLPDLLSLQSNFKTEFWRKYSELENSDKKWSELQRKVLFGANYRKAMLEDWAQRSLIGQARDSGYQLYEACAKRPDLKIETVNPVYDQSDGFVPPTVSRLQREMEKSIPEVKEDRLFYLPRRDGYMVRKGFKFRGYPDFRALGWEEFIWMKSPFAFHIRGEVHRARLGEVQDSLLVDGLNAILKRYGSARITTTLPQELEPAEPLRARQAG
jgi:hypothetical protein